MPDEPIAATRGEATPGPEPHVRDSHDVRVAAGIFGLALGVRGLHLRELAANDPFYTIASVDGAIYDAWARAMLDGQGLGEGVLFLGPLYPLFMAAVYSVFGASLPALKAVQAVLGAGACVLVWGLARELFDRRVALLSGLAAALYGMHVFYGGTAMIVNLQVPLVVGLVWAATRALRAPSLARWALCGALLGLSALARQTVLLLAPLLALWVLFGMAGAYPFARRLAYGTTFGVVILALILPFTLRNYVVGDDVVLLNSTGGANFYMGNRDGADGTWQLPDLDWPVRVDNPREMRDAFAAVAETASGRTLRPSEVSGYWLGRGVDEIRADPLRWIALETRKLALFVNAAEVWNNRSVDVSRRFSWVLRLPLPTFGVLAPLALLGLALTWRRWRELVPIHGAIAAYLASALLFFVLSRYRMPATVLMIPFAAFAACALFDRVRAAAWSSVAVQGVAVGLLAVLVHWPLVEDDERMHMAWYNLGNKYRELERWDEAVEAYRASLEVSPAALSTWNNLALAYELGGRRDEAIEAWRTVRVLATRVRSGRHLERAARHLAELEGGAPAAPPTP